MLSSYMLQAARSHRGIEQVQSLKMPLARIARVYPVQHGQPVRVAVRSMPV